MSGKWNYFIISFVVIICILLYQIIFAPQSQVQNMQLSNQSQKVIELLVINKVTKEPIPETALSMAKMTDDGKNVSWDGLTDENGKCRIELGERQPVSFRVIISKEKFVTVSLTWDPYYAVKDVPAQYTVSLEPGTSIGGIVQDEQGKPIEGVSINLSIPGGNETERVALFNYEFKTDAEGKWRCDIIPSKLNSLWINLRHTDYIEENFDVPSEDSTIEKLREMSLVKVMKKGLEFSGRVLDTKDQPVVGALIRGDGLGEKITDLGIYSDSEGKFMVKNAKAGTRTVIVQSQGYSPDVKQINVTQDMPPIVFRLEKGHTIKGRAVDKKGKPISGAFAAVDSWRGNRLLVWRVNTNEEGRFVWNDAPADEVLIDMGKVNYMSVRGYSMKPSNKEYVITMKPELKITGRVVDASTGQPIPNFQLISGIYWGEGRDVTWERSRPKTFTRGAYEMTFDEPRAGHVLRAEADGYQPEISELFMDDEGSVVYDFKLKKGAGPSGVVKLPDGTIAQGAEIFLCNKDSDTRVDLHNGQIIERFRTQTIIKSEDGKFSFLGQLDSYIVVALHDEGYAQLTDEDFGINPVDVILQPWGIVKGKLMIGTKPGANEKISLSFDLPLNQIGVRFYNSYDTVTDDKGNYIFERVSPGQVRIYHWIKNAEGKSSSTLAKSIEVKPGKTCEVTLGGTGRPVIGKLKLPDNIKNTKNPHTLQSVEAGSPDSPYHYLSLKLESDGSFRIDDVPAGDYKLVYQAYETSASGQVGKLLGFIPNYSFKVPEIPGGISDEPLDLGTIDVFEVNPQPAVAPSLVDKALPALSDFNIDLSQTDTQGKMMLLCFFDYQQRPSRNCITQLSTRAQEFKSKGIVVAAVQASKIDKGTMDMWLKDQNISFPMGMIEADEEKTLFNWGVKSLPWLILTDKQHIVTAEGFSITELNNKNNKFN
jgi:hypothetical protein